MVLARTCRWEHGGELGIAVLGLSVSSVQPIRLHNIQAYNLVLTVSRHPPGFPS